MALITLHNVASKNSEKYLVDISFSHPSLFINIGSRSAVIKCAWESNVMYRLRDQNNTVPKIVKSTEIQMGYLDLCELYPRVNNIFQTC